MLNSALISSQITVLYFFFFLAKILFFVPDLLSRYVSRKYCLSRLSETGGTSSLVEDTHPVASVLYRDAQENQDLSSNTRQHLQTSATHSTRTRTAAVKYKHGKSEAY